MDWTRVNGRASALSISVVAGLGLLQLHYMHPTLAYRNAYNPQIEFYSGLPSVISDGSLLVGMDNCGIASYLTGLACKKHPVDPDEAAYMRFAERLRGWLAERPVYLLPDFYAYDGLQVLRERVAEDFVTKPVYTAWGEDYHHMTYAPSVSAARLRLWWLGCEILDEKGVESTVADSLGVRDVTLDLRCRDTLTQQKWTLYDGHSIHLKKQSVLALEEKPQ
jgi:hypothetical protein